MKLKSKKTGEIVSLIEIINIDERLFARLCEPTGVVFKREIKTLSDLFEEWEDAPEEPKEHWFINSIGGIETTDRDETDEPGKAMIEIGNHFISKEEAEKAVEKLKAIVRLKDKGFRFDGYGHYRWTGEEWPHIAFSYPNFDDLFDDNEAVADLDLLFGGEE